MAYVAYLRKSRTDIEAEARGEGETLARHRHILMDLAKRMRLPITDIYEEIVSGEMISSRPQMQRLLAEVEQGKWEGVFVVEVERLARGDSIDQGIVAQAFKYSKTKIITPTKVYDPNNEFDEEYFEFGLFMSRREYKTIKRRMIAGRISSVKEGKYMGKTDPFGYRRVKLKHDKGYTLEIVPEQAKIVENIFKWYLEGQGYGRIANRLNACQTKTPTGLPWQMAQVRAILKNCLYCGYVTWGHKANVKSVVNGKLKNSRKYVDDFVLQKGLHPPIVSEENFNAAQQRMTRFPSFNVPKSKTLRNPFQGILFCAKCGHKMRLSTDPRVEPPRYGVFCTYKGCNNVSCRMTDLEQALICALQEWLNQYKVQVSEQAHSQDILEVDSLTDELTALESEKNSMENQLERAFDLVEKGIYTTEQFLARQNTLNERLKNIDAEIAKTSENLAIAKQRIQTRFAIAPKMEHVLSAYQKAESASEKNELLRSVLDKILYEKSGWGNRKSDNARIILHLYPIIPDKSI